MMRALTRKLQHLLPASDSGLYILAYHLVGAGSSSPVDLDTETFRHQMRELRDTTVVLSLDEAAEALHQGRAFSELSTVVTFDDAYENFLTHAWPILEATEIPVMLYVPVNFVDGSGPAPIRGTDSLAALSWSQLRELASAPSLTIGSHTLSHRDLTRLPREDARREIAESKRILEDQLRRPVTSFCYPRALWSRPVEELVSRSYESAVVAGGRRITGTTRVPSSRLSRVPIRRDMSPRLAPVLRSPIWIEEGVAALVRRLRP